jgi:hypothetical protein
MIKINKKRIFYFLIVFFLIFLIAIKTDIFILNFINSFNGITSFNGKGIKEKEHRIEIHIGEKYCKFRGGKMVLHDINKNKPAASTCIFEYSDSGKTCYNSNECEGECILNKPQIGIIETGLEELQNYLNENKNCRQYKTHVYEVYCENSNLTGTCQSLPDNGCDNKPHWKIIDNNIIGFHYYDMCVQP